eukprot:160442_1
MTTIQMLLAIVINVCFVSNINGKYDDNPLIDAQFATHIDEEWSFLYEEPKVTITNYTTSEPTDTYDIVYQLMSRVLGGTNLLDEFELQLIVSDKKPIYQPTTRDKNHPFWKSKSALYLDIMELDSNDNKIILRGSSTIALISAFNWYLKDWCNTTYDWSTYTVDMPASLPLPTYGKKIKSVPFTYYQNVCTVSYSFAFWDWDTWQSHIDWMAMQGVNMPLAFNGQEYIWAKTFATFGFNTSDLQSFFAGPAFYAWQRMGNIQGFGGPLREEIIIQQYELQLQILSRMYSFGMFPVLTCFAGHVPNAITRLYPHADVSRSPPWSGFVGKYCCVHLLNFTDPLFQQIGSKFIALQQEYFGAYSHIYQCDSFNEMAPASNNSKYLNAASSLMYNAMDSVDINAVWLMQGWLFVDEGEENNFWTNQTVKEYLGGVPNDAMIILDLATALQPVYSKFNSFYGKPFLWNTLNDYGGSNGIKGNLAGIGAGLPYALSYPNTSVIGVGITMEGIWQNYVIYDLTLQMGWNNISVDIESFIYKYSMRRYGLLHTANGNNMIVNNMNKAWSQLANTVYNLSISNWPLPELNVPSLSNYGIPYNPEDIQNVWKLYIQIGNGLHKVEKFRWDLVDVTRQALSDQFVLKLKAMRECYNNNNNITCIKENGNNALDILNDLDNIL